METEPVIDLRVFLVLYCTKLAPIFTQHPYDSRLDRRVFPNAVLQEFPQHCKNTIT